MITWEEGESERGMKMDEVKVAMMSHHHMSYFFCLFSLEQHSRGGC